MTRKPLYLAAFIVALLPFWLAQAAECPKNCYSCDSETGQCTSCSGDEWWGPTCSTKCPEHCTYGRCDMKTGLCDSCSSSEWWGPTCSNKCPENCTYGRCDFKTGLCESCSGDEWWGERCLSKCPEHCTYGRCDMKTGKCGSCSSSEWWGETCSNKCPEHCTYQRCNMETGLCDSCSSSEWWGPTCSNKCPENCTYGRCDFKTGLCGSCSSSEWWGPTCLNKCSEHCQYGRCDMKTGCCNGCAGDYSGSCTCSISSQCAKPKGVNCDWYSNFLLPATKDCPIIKDIMSSKCQEYHDLESSLSPMGTQWSQYVRSCVQKELAKNILVPALSGSVNCQKATDTFFGVHLGCYLEGPVSFCQLPYGDITRIMKQGANVLFTKHWFNPLITGAQLKFGCDAKFWETVLQDHFGNDSNN